MSRHTGSQHRGADHDARTERRLAAQARDDVTTATRRQPEHAELEKDCS